MAGGLELAIMCDLRVVEENSKMGFLNRRWIQMLEFLSKKICHFPFPIPLQIWSPSHRRRNCEVAEADWVVKSHGPHSHWTHARSKGDIVVVNPGLFSAALNAREKDFQKSLF